MLKIENTEVLGWEHAIRGMRNPLNSWAKSDSEVSICECEHWPHDVKKSFVCLGSNDLDLMKRLRNAGTDHRKFMRMIVVYVDLTAPLYWWKEFDTYKVGTVANSCSTMHKIAEKEFTLEDFSCEHLEGRAMNTLEDVVDDLNYYREHYLSMDKQKVPHYKSRRNHKLDEWHTFCDWIEGLPYSELITGGAVNE